MRRRPRGHRRRPRASRPWTPARSRPRVDEAIAANADAWEKFKAGDPKVSGLLIGQVMKATQGKADGKAVTALLRARAGL